MTRRVGTARSARLDWRIVALAGAIVVALIVVVVALLVNNGDPKYVGVVQPDEGRNHVPVGQFPSYRSVPATSGPHWSSTNPPAPMPWGVYTSPVEEPAAVHNLEHGGAVIWYQPAKLSADQIAQLTDFVNAQVRTTQFKFILTPWSGRDFGHPIAVTAWRWLLYLDNVNVDGIHAFADAHYGKSPEPLGGPAAPGI